jgi:hypothetical protein
VVSSLTYFNLFENKILGYCCIRLVLVIHMKFTIYCSLSFMSLLTYLHMVGMVGPKATI